jgi:hypothetical protein
VSRIILLFTVCLLLTGCSSPEKRAQKLFEQGRYEEVIAKYPTLPISKQAKDKIAEKLLVEGKYDEILANYGDTPSAAEATNKIAVKLYNERRNDQNLRPYDQILPHYRSPERLFRDGDYDELLTKFPDSPAAVWYRNFIAQNQWNRIEDLRGAKRDSALQEFLKDPKYLGTDAAQKAQQEINNLKR